MKVITPGQVARSTGSKYLGVLVAAKYARSLNEFRSGEVFEEPAPGAELREKLSTTALREVAQGTVDYRLVQRRRPEL
jgi:DNA-directed RNA polymerase omega subunit